MRLLDASMLRGALALLVALAPVTVVAQETAGAASTAPLGVSAEAQAVMDRMTNYMKGLQAFSIAARESRDEVLSFGYKLQNNQTSTMVVQLPDKLRVDVDGDIKTRTYLYDGKTLTIHAGDRGVYAQVDAPSTLGELLDGLLNRGVDMPLIDVLLQARKGTLGEGVRAGLLVGDSSVEGVATDHLAFRQPTIDWQMWVEKGDRPLPRKFVITTRYEVGDPQYEVVLDWNLKPKIDRKTFAFAPPTDTRKIRFNDDAAAAAGGGQP